MKKKWVLRIVSGVLVIAMIIGIGFVIFIDKIARLAVEQGGTYALGVQTTLDRMHIGLVSGVVSVSGLTVANPENFEAPHFFRLDGGQVAVRVGSLAKDTVVAPELALSGILMNLEQKADKANYKVILENLKKFESEQTPQQPTEQTTDAPEPQKSQGKRFVIEKLTLRDIQVNVDLLPIGGKLTRVPVTIDLIELEDVGSDSDQGVLIAQLTGIVIKGILSAVARDAGDLIPEDIAAGIDQGLRQLGDGAGQIVEQLGEQIDETGQHIDQAGKAVGEQLEEVGKQIGKGFNDLLDIDQKSDDKSP